MSEAHRYVGFFVVGLFALGWLMGLGIWIRRRGAGRWFWRWLTAAQVVSGVQALIGAILVLVGYRRQLLHYAYGVFPIVALAIAHGVARQEQFRARPWVPFGWAAFFSFGLTLRALMTGLGIG